MLGGMRSHIGVGAALLLVLAGCSKSESAPRSSPAASASAPAPVPAPFASRSVSGEAAFDLVATDDGALLVWGEGDALRASVLDARGTERDAPIAIEPSRSRSKRHVVEVSAASAGSRVGVAWVESAGGEASTWGALGDASTRSFTPPAELGEVTLTDERQRGNVALTASDRAEFLALRRGVDEPCAEDPSLTCATLGFRELLSTGPERRGLPMAVPAACPTLIAGFAVIGDRWHYAVCSRKKGPPMTTQFNVQRSPFYAEAKDLAPGCSPLGMSVIAGEAVTAFDCSDGRRAQKSGGLAHPTGRVDLAHASLQCERGRPVLRAPDEQLVVELGAPKSGLAPLLPLRIAAAGARAVWTGSTLLVATWVKQKVELRRWECRGSELARSP